MKYVRTLTAVVIATFLGMSSGFAQWQVPTDKLPVGRGGATQGFKSTTGIAVGSDLSSLLFGSVNAYLLRNNAGSFSLVDTGGTNEFVNITQAGNANFTGRVSATSLSTVSTSDLSTLLSAAFLGNNSNGGTYLVPGGSTASTPLTAIKSVWNAANTSFPFTGTISQGKTLLNTLHGGSHTGAQLFSSAVNAQVTGSGTNGPVQGDYGLGCNVEKTGWQTNVGASGEIGCLYVRVRQNAATPNSGDGSGILLDVANLGNSGFLAAAETITTNLSAVDGHVLKAIDTQIGVIDSNSGKSYGFVATAFTGALDYGVFIQSQAGGGTFANPYAYSNASGLRWAVNSISQMLVYPDDGVSSNFFYLRNNGGSFSLVNTAGSTEFFQVNQAGAMSAATLALTGSPLAAVYGGLGQSTYVLGDILYASAANTISKLAGNTTSTKKFLRQTGTGSVSAAPAWDTFVAGDVPLTSAHWLIGNSSNVAVDVAMSGDTTVDNAGVVTIGAAKVSYAKIQNLGALALIGRSANTSGVGADIQATAASDAVLRESGGVIGFGTIATGGIGNNAVTLAKLATQTANTTLGNATSGGAVPTALAMPSCSTAASALNYTTSGGASAWSCNTSITAASMPTTGLTGTLQAAQEPAHTGDVTNTAGSLALTLVTGNAGNLNSGTLLAARMPALTGDVTTVVGNVATTLATAQAAVHTWALAQTFTVAPVFTDQSGSRTALGLGTAATQNTGTSGTTLPFLNVANTWSGGGQTFTSASTYPLTVRGGASSTNLILIDTFGATQQAGLVFSDNGSIKWDFFKQSDQSFVIFDGVNAISSLAITPGAAAAGKATFAYTTVSTSKTTGSLVNNGGFGNAGALFTDTLSVITMANTATTSAVCYNIATGLFTYDGTLGTCTVSDERLKDVVGPITSALDKVLAINGFYYTWRDPAYGTGVQVGVGAQTVERVFPELVQTDATGKKSVDYQRLVAPIIEALRELKADNENMRTEMAGVKRASTGR